MAAGTGWILVLGAATWLYSYLCPVRDVGSFFIDGPKFPLILRMSGRSAFSNLHWRSWQKLSCQTQTSCMINLSHTFLTAIATSEAHR